MEGQGDPLGLVVAAWQADAALCRKAATGVMAVVGKRQDLTRREVCANKDVLLPIVKHLGNLAF